jgi:hypothetical protein
MSSAGAAGLAASPAGSGVGGVTVRVTVRARPCAGANFSVIFSFGSGLEPTSRLCPSAVIRIWSGASRPACNRWLIVNIGAEAAGRSLAPDGGPLPVSAVPCPERDPLTGTSMFSGERMIDWLAC